MGTEILIVRGLLRRPSLSGTPTVTFSSVHIHNVVAKKRDASTEPLRRLHGYVQQHNVDFIGGDFNMSAFSTVGDAFSDPEFSALGNSLASVGRIVSALGSSSCPSVQMSGVWIHMAATSSKKQIWRLDPVTKPLTFLCFSTSSPPTYLVPTAPCAANKLSKDGLSANTTNSSAGRDDVVDRDVVDQSHVSACFPTSSAVASESLGRQLFPVVSQRF